MECAQGSSQGHVPPPATCWLVLAYRRRLLTLWGRCLHWSQYTVSRAAYCWITISQVFPGADQPSPESTSGGKAALGWRVNGVRAPPLSGGRLPRGEQAHQTA
eukprot:3340100-Pyramimonas_sp.AAC.1